MTIKNISTILFEGWYTDDENEVVNSHTEETYQLYLKGLESCGILSDNDLYEGIIFENDVPFAQVDRNGIVEYITL